MAQEVGNIKGVTKVLLADSPAFKGFLAESLTPVVLEAQKQFEFSHIFSNASAFGKVMFVTDIMPATLLVTQSINVRLTNTSEMRGKIRSS